MLGSIKKAGGVALAAAAMLAVGSTSVLASGGWDPFYATLREGGQCEQFKFHINDLAHCTYRGKDKICEYSLQIGNGSGYLGAIDITLTALPQGYQLLLPGPHHSFTMKKHQWQTIKVLRTSAQRPPTGVTVSIDCTVAMH